MSKDFLRKILVVGTLFGGAAQGQNIVKSGDVAPKAADSIMQMWPRAIWSGGANCWLVAWREGDTTSGKSDIWCARVAADGTTLDPAGIRLTEGPGLKDRPSIASDGKDFLVVWEDLRNGKDFDIFGAHVTGAGKVLEPNGVVLAGGTNNQVRPTALHLKDGYRLLYVGFFSNGGPAGAPGTGYILYQQNLTADLKISGNPLILSDAAIKRHLFEPFAAAGENGLLAAAYLRIFGPDYSSRTSLGTIWQSATPNAEAHQMVSTAEGKPAVGIAFEARAYLQAPAVVWNGESYLVAAAIVPSQGKFKDDSVLVIKFDAEGNEVDKENPIPYIERQRVVMNETPKRKANPRVSLASDGARVLITQDSLFVTGRGTSANAHVCVKGRFLDNDGKPLGEPFVIADDDTTMHDCMQGFAASSSNKGAFLVVCSEARTPDEVRVTARVVQ